MKGKVKIQTYDTIDFDACKTASDFELIKTTQEPVVVNNAIVTAWKNNIASALCDRTWGWSTPSVQVCFEGVNADQRSCDNQSGAGDWFTGEVSSYGQTCIEISNSSSENTLMHQTTTTSLSTNAISIIGYMQYSVGTFTSAQVGLLNSWTRSGNGTPTWYEQMANSTFSVSIGVTETTKLTWIITLTG